MMKTRKIGRTVSFLIVMASLVTCMSIPAFATDITSEISFDKADLSYQVYDTKDAFLDEYSVVPPSSFSLQANISQLPSISNMSIYGNGESVSLELPIDGQQQTFTGSLYPIVGGGYYDDKLVLGDFSSSSNYNMVSFRIEKIPQSSIILRLVLEKLSDGEIYDINIELTDNQFNMFHQVALDYYELLEIEPNTDAYIKMMQKTVSLMQIDKNWFSSDANRTASARGWATPFNYDSLSTANTGVAVDRSILNSFFTNMNNYGTSGYRYSSTSTMGKVLNQLGWKVYHNKSASAPYFYVSYGVDNGGASRLVQIILCGYSSNYNSTSGCAEAHMEVYGSVLVEWDTSYDVGNCKILYYSGGPELTDVYLCASELAGTNTIFTDSYITFSLYSNKNPWAGFLISRIPKYGSLIVNIWNNLKACSTTEESKWGRGYEVTVDAQDEAGGLIKDVCARSGTASLLSVGNYLHLKGTVHGTYFSHTTKFMFTAENII